MTEHEITADPDSTTNPELSRRLKYIHETLELIALLLAVLAIQQGTIGTIVGVGAVLLLVVNVASRTL